MLEKDIENLIAQHPDEFFPGEGFRLIGQQVEVKRKKIDILFEDKFKRQIIVEVKRGLLPRDAAGQVMEYYGLLIEEQEKQSFELILCANNIPPERVKWLENAGIGCKVIPAQRIRDLALKYDYTFIDDQTSHKPSRTTGTTLPKIIENGSKETTVWIFQGNPNIYDILNSLDDNEVGNLMHWSVNQHFNKIHKGHLVLLWMSGPEAGIYALARVECEPGMMEEFPGEKKYWYTEKEEKVALRVRMAILRRFVNQPILRETIKGIPELSQLSILKHSQGTNFPVRDSEWMIINSLM